MVDAFSSFGEVMEVKVPIDSSQAIEQDKLNLCSRNLWCIKPHDSHDYNNIINIKHYQHQPALHLVSSLKVSSTEQFFVSGVSAGIRSQYLGIIRSQYLYGLLLSRIVCPVNFSPRESLAVRVFYYNRSVLHSICPDKFDPLRN